MGTILRTIYDRLVQFPDRFKLTAVPGQPDTYSVAPDPGTVTQEGTPINKGLLQPMVDCMYNSAFFNPYTNKVEFTTSTTWTVPTGAYKIALWLMGAGGGTAATAGGGTAGAGSGLCVCVRQIDVTPGQSITIAIGAGVGGSDGGATAVLGYTAYGGKRALIGDPGGGDGGGGGGSVGNNGGHGGPGGQNGTPGASSGISIPGRSLSGTINPFDGKNYGSGGGAYGSSGTHGRGGYADIGSGGDFGQDGSDPGGGAGGTPGGGGSHRGGNGLAIIYY